MVPALSRCACSPGVLRKVLEGLNPQLAPALPCQTLLRAGLPRHLCRRQQGGADTSQRLAVSAHPHPCTRGGRAGEERGQVQREGR